MRISYWSSDVCSSDLLIALSLNQISKAYGENNAILDNCHVRIAFSSNDERTAKRISDAPGTATELRAQRNYAGHRLAQWPSPGMVSRQEIGSATWRERGGKYGKLSVGHVSLKT